MTLTPMRPGGAIRRWDPFREMEEMYDRMNQLMQEYFVRQMPPALADVEETDDGFIVEVDVPGAKPDNVNLELRDNELRVTGEIKEREHKGVVRRHGRRVGEFEHVVALPAEVDPQRVNAKLHDGVLTVEVGKATTGRPRRIEVKAT